MLCDEDEHPRRRREHGLDEDELARRPAIEWLRERGFAQIHPEQP